MKVRICTDRGEVISSIYLTKKDIEERTWAKYVKVELRKEKGEGSTFECFAWTSENHNDNEIILNYEYINGFVTSGKSDEREIIRKLIEDREWLETVEKLKKFVDKYLEQILKQ